MKQLYIIILTFLVSTSLFAQKYYTKTGKTEFKASVETFEPIEAANNSTTVILNTENGQIAALLFVKAFHFEIALMQEHFNENYMDSDKHPKATFKGALDGFSMDKLSDKESEFNLKGTLTVRGIAKEINTKARLKKQGSKIKIEAEFKVKPQDFDIKIPNIVREKIAKSIHINLNYELVEKK